ncbi:MAG: exopolyphosphatase [Micavibrio aeruginosavorus]|uniref:Exopolyphosphatase n=1 Tax=Micavibrio aeruginosavorus TaxID=349221 RepID=A0A7T5R179_9BACT|nr:MAG: exopolyphosphatase [Micavibrio aeruginosavorus]
MTTATKLMPEPNTKYRLITRSDMDGLVCGLILKELDLIDEIEFAHPKDMQDGKIPVSKRDITTNLPYVDGVYMCFDHHASEIERVNEQKDNYIMDAYAPSAARVLFNYFGGHENPRLAHINESMMKAVDKADSASFTREDILDPQGWELLSFLMDSRTGLGRFRDFTISNYQLMMKLIDYCRECHTIDEILNLPDVKERVDLYHAQALKARQQIERCATVHKNLVVLDLRDEDQIWAANRFIIYALFPSCNISIHVLWGKGQQNTVLATGKSILNRTSRTNVGTLMLKYGGGGHEAAGTCQINNDLADKVLEELIIQINKDG